MDYKEWKKTRGIVNPPATADIYMKLAFDDASDAYKPKWNPIDKKCKDGSHYLFRDKKSKYPTIDCWVEAEGFLNEALMENEEMYEYCEIPQ